MMSRQFVVAAILLTLFVGLFAQPIFEDSNFVYRDAGHFYYPLFRVIQDEWSAGRVPLWNPQENGGAPLAGNPTASVFYPLKLIFFCLPYPTAYKWYLMGHVALAWAACFVASRQLGTSPLGSTFAATAFAFSGFVFFQIYNIVFLCGAAWLPLGLLATHWIVRSETKETAWHWLLLFAAVLALQVLAGDPQVAYMSAVAAGIYAILFHLGARRGMLVLGALLAIGYAWHNSAESWRAFAAMQRRITLIGSAATPKMIADNRSALLALAGALVAGSGGVVMLAVGWRRAWSNASLRRTLMLLVGSGAVAFGLAAVQTFVTADLVRFTGRAAPDSPHETIGFSFFPARLLELAAPFCFGRDNPITARFAPFQLFETRLWVPTIYLGLLPFVLGVASMAWRRGTNEQRWLTWLVLITLWLSAGKFGGPRWLFDERLGKPVDLLREERGASTFGSGDGLYWLAENTIPGWRAFRYPSKLLVFSTLGMALLAGFGWDRLWREHWLALERTLFMLALAALFIALTGVGLRSRFEAWIEGMKMPPTIYGFMNPSLGASQAVGSFLQCAFVAGCGWLAIALARDSQSRRREQISIAVLALTAFDLFLTLSPMLYVDEQSAIDAKPAVLQAIEANERKHGTTEPYRVHRTPLYHPLLWNITSSSERFETISRWERNTMQPKYGLPFGVHFTSTAGTMEIYDVEFFFAPWAVDTPKEWRVEGKIPEVMTYFPRRGFNLWNTKYFILPAYVRLDDPDRGIFTLTQSAEGEMAPVIAQSDPKIDDFQVIQNPEAFPRAWIVHRADVRPPIYGLRREDRLAPMEELLWRDRDGGAHLWTKGFAYGEYPLRTSVMIETDSAAALDEYQSRLQPRSTENVQFEKYCSDEVRLKAKLDAPGLIVIADTYYPGWTATVDGKPAPIYRANRAMRAIPASAGEHEVVMTFRSVPFIAGAIVSGVTMLATLAFFAVRAIAKAGVRTASGSGTIKKPESATDTDSGMN